MKREKKWLEPWLNFPVVCPECGKQECFALPLGVVAEALLKDSAIELYVSCHDIYWNADRAEIELIRIALRDVAGISIQRVPPSIPDELIEGRGSQNSVERAPPVDLGA